MTRLARVLALALVGVLGPQALHAQFALDADLRRAIQTYQGGRYDAAATELARIADRPTLTNADRAVAHLYRGFALYRLKRDAESSRALEQAVVVDPTLRPDPVTNPAELLEAWRRARLRIPLLRSFEIAATEFVPGVDSAARLDYTFEVSVADRGYTSQMRFLLVRGGTADTAVAWTGLEGQPGRWDGNVNGQPIAAGIWEMILEARAPGSTSAGYARKRAEVELLTASVDRRLAMPTAPRFLPETVTFNRVDDEARSARITRGLWMLGVGTVLAAYSNVNYKVAIGETAKGSGQRIVVASSYVGGAALLGFGSWYTITGLRRNYETPVAFPSTENVRRNRELRIQYSADSARVTEQNRALAGGRLVRLRFIGEGAR